MISLKYVFMASRLPVAAAGSNAACADCANNTHNALASQASRTDQYVTVVQLVHCDAIHGLGCNPRARERAATALGSGAAWPATCKLERAGCLGDATSEPAIQETENNAAISGGLAMVRSKLLFAVAVVLGSSAMILGTVPAAQAADPPKCEPDKLATKYPGLASKKIIIGQDGESPPYSFPDPKDFNTTLRPAPALLRPPPITTAGQSQF